MLINTSHRSEEAEIMDDFLMTGEILQDALDKIARINQLLGGNRLTIDGVKKLIKHHSQDKNLHILDIGCGNGDMLRTLTDFSRKHELNFKFTGIDANAFTIDYAKKLSTTYPEINYQCKDFLKEEIEPCDIILCTLTLHHFKDKEIIELLTKCKNKSNLGIVVNDLHRNALAYYLFKALCFAFGLNEMSRKDGLISILRGFKKSDLQLFSKQLNLNTCSIKWRWAFRYQWIIKTT